MPVYVRKLASRKNIDTIRTQECLDTIPADVITSEFRTKSNTLSVWQVTDIDHISPGILAIALSSSYINTMDFILIDGQALSKNGLSIKQTPAANNPYIDAVNIHHDITDLTLEKLYNVSNVYKDSEAVSVIRLTSGKLKQMIKDAEAKGLINVNFVNSNIKDELKRFGINFGDLPEAADN
jgi:hypothetical protein